MASLSSVSVTAPGAAAVVAMPGQISLPGVVARRPELVGVVARHPAVPAPQCCPEIVGLATPMATPCCVQASLGIRRWATGARVDVAAERPGLHDIEAAYAGLDLFKHKPVPFPSNAAGIDLSGNRYYDIEVEYASLDLHKPVYLRLPSSSPQEALNRNRDCVALDRQAALDLIGCCPSPDALTPAANSKDFFDIMSAYEALDTVGLAPASIPFTPSAADLPTSSEFSLEYDILDLYELLDIVGIRAARFVLTPDATPSIKEHEAHRFDVVDAYDALENIGHASFRNSPHALGDVAARAAEPQRGADVGPTASYHPAPRRRRQSRSVSRYLAGLKRARRLEVARRLALAAERTRR